MAKISKNIYNIALSTVVKKIYDTQFINCCINSNIIASNNFSYIKTIETVPIEVKDSNIHILANERTKLKI